MNMNLHKLNSGLFSGKAKKNYEEIIKDYARDGWRLHTFAPISSGAGGQALSIQLIFEREQK